MSENKPEPIPVTDEDAAPDPYAGNPRTEDFEDNVEED